MHNHDRLEIISKPKTETELKRQQKIDIAD